ncbi:MAG: hypothetical protein JNG89_13340 [Planctomycetaceae bacterium]|nr:hypothetical protein [Planctomycetaceae bacterium]
MSSGLMSATCLWLAAALVSAQDPPAAETESAPPAEAEPVVPAQAPLDESKYDPPLYDKEKATAWERSNGELRFKQALRLERLGGADRETVTKSIQHYLYKLTIKEERPNLHIIVQKLLETINSKQLTTPEGRNFVNEEIVRIAPELLGQPPAIRLNVVIVAASLVSDATTTPPRPYFGAAPLFLSILDDPNQLVECKLWAVKGLGRLCRDVDFPVTERSKVATKIVTVLGDPQAMAPQNWWYRLRLVEALGDTGLCYDLQRQPIIIDTLVAVLSSNKEHWMVRTTAARAATQLPWQQADSINVPLITYQICKITREMAAERNARLNGSHWPYSFLSMYLSFNPQTAEQKQKNWGLLQKARQPGYTQHEPLVTSAYQALLPVVNSVMGSRQPRQTTADEIQLLDDWLKNNVPADNKPTPSSKQVDLTPRRDPMANADQR